MINRNMILTRKNGTSILVLVQYNDSNIDEWRTDKNGRRVEVSKQELDDMITGVIRQETINDKIAFGHGASCRYCGRNITAEIMRKIPNVKPIIIREPYEYVYCSLDCEAAAHEQREIKEW